MAFKVVGKEQDRKGCRMALMSAVSREGSYGADYPAEHDEKPCALAGIREVHDEKSQGQQESKRLLIPSPPQKESVG